MSFRLRDLPVEIRILIFRKCVWQYHCCKAPALIEALRGNPLLYQEALEVYYAINEFSVTFVNQDRVFSLNSDFVLKRLTSLKLTHGTILKKEREWEYVTSFPRDRLSTCFNVRKLSLFAASRYNGAITVRQMISLVAGCVLRLPALKTLIVEVPSSDVQSGTLSDESMARRDYTKYTALIDRATGITSQIYKSERWHNSTNRWDAGHDETITWTEGGYFKSLPWSLLGSIYFVLTGWHINIFWEEHGLQFLGLNPRQFLVVCCRKNCVCKRMIPIHSGWFDPTWYRAVAPSGVGPR